MILAMSTLDSGVRAFLFVVAFALFLIALIVVAVSPERRDPVTLAIALGGTIGFFVLAWDAVALA